MLCQLQVASPPPLFALPPFLVIHCSRFFSSLSLLLLFFFLHSKIERPLHVANFFLDPTLPSPRVFVAIRQHLYKETVKLCVKFFSESVLNLMRFTFFRLLILLLRVRVRMRALVIYARVATCAGCNCDFVTGVCVYVSSLRVFFTCFMCTCMLVYAYVILAWV